MGNFYFDESVHPQRGEFVLGTWVYGADAELEVGRILVEHGIAPFEGEYKSSGRKDADPRGRELRSAMIKLLCGYKLGVVLAPIEERHVFGNHALFALAQFLKGNGLHQEAHQIFLDQGLFTSTAAASQLAEELGITPRSTVHFGCDSRHVLGLQLADLAAHACSTMLLETIGEVTKTVRAGNNSGYDPDTDVELGFEIWAGLRSCFFHCGPVPGQSPLYNGALMDVGDCGLYVAPHCGELLKEAAVERFGTTYLGCIH